MKARVVKLLSAVAMATAFMAVTSAPAAAQAVITNGSGVALGINIMGNLNTSDPNGVIVPYNTGGPVGVAYLADYASAGGFDGAPAGLAWGDATAPGCLCEGFGVAVTTAAAITHVGSANADDGSPVNLTSDSFVFDADSAVAIAHLTNLDGLSITHDFHPSTSGSLYEVTVTITNKTGGTVDDVRYKRVMDWDVPPTTFSELVTLQGAGLGDLVDSCDNGFEVSDPTVDCSPFSNEDVNFTDEGPADIGALFTFNFGSLIDGASKTFNIYYGAAPTEAAALAALAAVGAEGIYSFGQNSTDSGRRDGSPATFIFGFGGVGAPPISAVPEPASLLLLGSGLAGAAARYRRRKTNA